MTRLDSRSTVIAAAMLIVVLALGAAGRGMSTIPLEDHEIYVAQTAENMLKNGDWLIPRLNGEYRLTKPPLSYWLVATAAKSMGRVEVSPAVARLPSVLSAAGIGLLAFWIGSLLYDRRVGFVGGLFCVASIAAFKFGHNARPDMLYTFWTTGVLAAWVGNRAARVSRQRWWSLALWSSFGLATMTKGPQAPLILLVGLASHALVCDETPAALFRRLKPIRGLVLVLVIVAPWYLMLRQSVGDQALGDSQLSGSLLTVNPLQLLAPYYFVHSPGLWLPWSILLPVALMDTWRHRRGPSGLLALTVILAMFVFALGPQYREVYMLPWLTPAMLVFTAATLRRPSAWYCQLVIYGAVVAGLGWLAQHSGPGNFGAVGVAGILMLIAGPLLWRREMMLGTVLLAIVFSAGLFQAGGVDKLWSRKRYDELSFTRALSTYVIPDMSVVVWDINPAHFSYYLDRPASGSENLATVCDLIAEQQRTTLLVYPTNRGPELAQRLTFTALMPDRKSDFSATYLVAGQSCRAPERVGA